MDRLNTILLVEKFKMETPETIGPSLIPGQWVASVDLPDTYFHIPIHPNTGKYCHNSQVFQFTSLSFVLAMAPQVFTMIVKEVYGPLKWNQTSPIYGRLVDQGLVHTKGTQIVVDLTVLGVDNKSEVKTQTHSGIFVLGLLISPRFGPFKTHSREMAQTSAFDPMLKVKTWFDCKMFDVPNWVLASMEKIILEGCLYMRPFQVHLKEHWEFS